MLWNRFTIAVCLLWVGHALAAKPLTGYRASVNVTEETRLDWIFPLANQSPVSPPNGWLDDYDSSEQSYELFVPKNYDSKRSWPVVIFVSPSDKGNGYRFWRGLCQQEGIIFAGPHGAGNNCP